MGKKDVKDESVLNGNNADTREDRSEKKKKKRKRENRDESEVSSSVVEEVVSNDSEKKSKKKKKNKECLDVDTTATSSSPALPADTSIHIYPSEEASKYPAVTSFSSLFPMLEQRFPPLKAYIQSKKFVTPTLIQRDLIGIASTGSGKTLAFLLPALCHALSSSTSAAGKAASKSPKILIIAPTRELAMQSYDVLQCISGVTSVCIYGGISRSQQVKDIKNLQKTTGIDAVVATPGRLIDLVQDNVISFAAVQYVVLDEADRMLDDGFAPAIRQIMGECPPKDSRQTLMFSATWPDEIRALAEQFLRADYMRVVVGTEELAANTRVTQVVECIEKHKKDRRLKELLEKYHSSRTNRCLIFVLYKKEAADLQNTIQRMGYSVTAIHGDKNQYDRTAALEEFKSGRVPLLIATDVAARGLDIPQVEYVINYSFPLTVEDYVHRIGRTGRAGARGLAHTFFTDFDKGLAGALVGVLQESNQEIPQDIYQYQLVTKKKTSKLYGDFGPKQDLIGKKATKITFD